MTERREEKEDTMTTTDNTITKDELTELVRAIKFAKPEASMRAVHREISEELSLKTGFEFLASVKQNDVKKVWKKAQQPQERQHAAAASTDKQQQQSQEMAFLPMDKMKDGLKLYTVGNVALKTLTEEYSQLAAAKVAKPNTTTTTISDEEYTKYVHVFLDVPGDRSGSRPHQALINFQDNTNTKTKTSTTKQDEKNPKKNNVKPTKTTTAAATTNTTTTNSDSENTNANIVKIQVAASDDATKFPMLLYNMDRTQKTFIHPDDDKEDDTNDGKTNDNATTTTEDSDNNSGYDKIRNLILTKGVGGSLGAAGGTKGYFYSRLTKRKNGPDVISIDIASGLAPEQPW